MVKGEGDTEEVVGGEVRKMISGLEENLKCRAVHQ